MSEAEFSAQIDAQGNTVRDLKAAKADKAAITAQVDKLKALKAEFKTKFGKEYASTAAPAAAAPAAAAPAPGTAPLI
jgi:bifunctional glutamyl/prolyl-tRNA synthetase